MDIILLSSYQGLLSDQLVPVELLMPICNKITNLFHFCTHFQMTFKKKQLKY